MTEVGCPGSHTIKFALPCMHHALTMHPHNDARMHISGAGSQIDTDPSTVRPRASQRCRALLEYCIALDVLQLHSAARAAQSRWRKRPRVLIRHHRRRPWCSDKHSVDTLEQVQLPLFASFGDLLLVLDDPSAGTEMNPKGRILASTTDVHISRALRPTCVQGLHRVVPDSRLPEHGRAVYCKIGNYLVYLGLDHAL